MKLLNRKDFLQHPDCLFSFFNEHYNEIWPLHIKYNTLENDFYYTNLWIEYSELWLLPFLNWEEIIIEPDSWQRDGMYNEKQKFVVYNKDDIQKIINALSELL